MAGIEKLYNQIMKFNVRLNAKVLPFIAASALIMQIIDPSRVWMILLVGIGGAWLFCRWWVRGLARMLTFEREVRYGWAQVGDQLEERFTLTNQFTMPATWMAVEDHSNMPDHHVSIATGVDSLSKSQWKMQSQCTRRGVYRLGGTTLRTGDPLGIFTLTLEDPTSSTLAVMPPVVSIPEFQILSSGWTGEGKTNPRSLEETINASHVREMVPSDPMKWIHWKSTARRNKFFVRQFEGTPAGDWWLLLDLDHASQLGAGWDSTEEHGVILAASLAARGLEQKHPVGLAVNGCEPSWIIPRQNENQQRTLSKALAVAAPSDLNLKAYLQRIGQALRSRSSLLIVTANCNVDWTESLWMVMRRGVMPTVFLFDPISFGGRGNTKVLEDTLHSLGVPCHMIPKELLDTKQARPGTAGRWEWRVFGTGKAIAVTRPEADWRRIG